MQAPYVCQAQSINVFVPADIHKAKLQALHYKAWKTGVKSLYYCRSTSMQRSDKVSHNSDGTGLQLEMSLLPQKSSTSSPMYDECLACQ